MTVLLPVGVALLGVVTALAVPTQQASPTGHGSFGNFSIDNYVRLAISPFAVKKPVVADVTGPNLVIHSPQYTLKAPAIRLSGVRIGKPAQLKVVDGTASGGVHVESRNATTKQTLILDGDKAVYHAAPNLADKGKLEVIGHVRSSFIDPTIAEGPVVQNSERATLTFPEPDNPQLVLENGSASGTLLEPKSKPQNPPTPKKQ